METDSLGTAIAAILGAVVLFQGRRLFWLFVGLVGFVFCFEWAPSWLPPMSDTALLGVATGVGVIGAALAVFLQYILVALAGLLVGAILGADLAPLLGLPAGAGWVSVGGALAGCVLALALLDWGLIVLSAGIGAMTVSQALGALFEAGHDGQWLLGAGLWVLGIAFQAHQLGRKSRG